MSHREDILNMPQENKAKLVELVKVYGVDKINPLQKVVLEDELWPVSIQQERVILDDILRHGTSRNIEVIKIDISRRCTTKQIKNSIQNLLDKNRILKIKIKEVDGEYFQLIDNEEVVPEIVNLKDLSIHDFVNHINIREGSLIRFGIMEKNSYYSLYIAIHHIICDELSNRLIVDTLRKYVDSKESEETITDQVDYLDFAIWQRENLMLGLYKNEINYWKNEFNGYDFGQNCLYPIDKSSSNSVYVDFVVVDEQMVNKLKEFANRYQCTFFQLLLCVYNVLIHRLTHEKDVVVGFPYVNRFEKTNDLIGFFATTTAQISHIDVNKRFSEYLTLQSTRIEAAIENAQIPLEYTLRLLNIVGKDNFSLIDNFFLFEQSEEDKADVSYVLNATRINFSESKFPLIFKVRECGNGRLTLKVEYDKELYSKVQMFSLMNSYKTLLMDAVKNEEKQIAELALLSEIRKKKLNQMVNHEVDIMYTEERIEEGFLRTAELYKENLCMSYRGKNYTYGQIRSYASKVSEMLFENGVKDGDRVLICDTSHFETIIIMLGVLIIGGTYVPVDYRDPPQRKQQIIRNCNPHFAVVEREFNEIVEDENIQQFIIYNNFLQQISEFKDFTEIQEKSNKIAYVMYTSGSTGEPKGVMIEHKGICRLVQKPNYIQVIKGDRMLQLAPLSFDASTFEIWISFYHGIPLFIYDQEISSFDELHSYLITNRISIVWLTTGLFNQMVSESVTYFDGIRAVYTGGDLANDQLIKQLKLAKPELVLVNMYGPTENTTFTTFYPITVENCKEGITIGKPINNTYIYILDDVLKQVDIGITGEICIGGAGLSCGYLGDKKLSDSKFFVSEETGEWLYKSGDIGYIRQDGNLVFVGRKDNQVKIRGFRVEIGEIESKIRSLMRINNCSICVTKDKLNNKKLICIVLSEELERMDLNVKFVKKEICKYLPTYMMPSEIYAIDEFKINANGKLDEKKILNEIKDARKKETKEDVIYDSLEARIVEIYAEVLGVKEEIGLADNFFELGGHSLTVISLVKKIRDSFSVEVSIRDIYKRPILKEMCVFIKNSTKYKSQENNILINTINETSYEQKAIYILKKTSDKNNYSMPFIFYLDGYLDIESLKKALLFTVEQNDLFKARFMELNGEFFYRESEILNIDKILKVEEVLEENTQGKLRFLARERLDNSLDRLFSFYIGIIKEKRYIMAFNFHHIIFDGLSAKIFFEELSINYDSYRCKKTMYKKNIKKYAEYSIRQFKENRYGIYQKLRIFWTEYLMDYEPLDISCHGLICQDVTQEITVSGEEYSYINEECIRMNVTMFTYMIAKIAKVFEDIYGKKDIVIGTPYDMRDADYQNCIGDFMNTIPIRIFDTDINSVQSQIILASENKKLPYSQIISCVPSSVRNDLIKIFVNQFSFNSIELKLGKCICEKFEEKIQFSKFDIVFYIDNERENITITCQSKKLNDGIVSEILSQILKNTMRERAEKETVAVAATLPNDIKSKSVLLEDFRRHAYCTPYAVAIKSKGLQVSYGELLQKINSICQMLRKENVSKGHRVMIVAKRDEVFVETVLACITLGAIFCIVDGAISKAEKQKYIKAVMPNYIINLSGILIKSEQGCIISREAIENCQSSYEDFYYIEHMEEDLFNMICTSGTTGIPKVVVNGMIPFNNFINWYKRLFAPSKDDCFSMISGLGHDPILRDIFIPLSSGSTIAIPEEDSILKLSLDEYIENSKITYIHCTPHMLNLFSREQKHTRIRYVLCSGDKFSKVQYQIAEKIFPCATIVNCYGATETPQIQSFHVVNGDEETLDLPVGRGIDNVNIDVLNDEYMSLGKYKIGQIAIRSECISLGYFNDEVETKKKFIKSKITDKYTVYLTGDIGYKLDNNEVVVLGRADSTVSIRGNRIELARITYEIEKEFEGVTSFAECKGEDIYVSVVALCGQIRPDEIMRYLIEILPSYMLPKNVKVFGKEAMLENGKINMKYIREQLENTKSDIQKEKVSSQISNELKALMKLVCEHVNEAACYEDNFYALGGNSLLAVKLSNILKEKEGLVVSAVDILSAKKFKDLEGRLIINASNNLTVNESFCVDATTFKATPVQRAIWLEDSIHEDARYNLYQMYEISGSLDISILENILGELKDRVPLLSCNFLYDVNRDILLAKKKQEEDFLEILSLKNRGTEKIQEILKRSINRLISTRLELDNDSLFKIYLFELNEQKNILLVLTHHILFDLTSISILNKAIGEMYDFMRRGERFDKLPYFNNYYENYKVITQNDYSRKLKAYRERLSGFLYQSLKRESICKKLNVKGCYLERTLPIKLTSDIKNFCKKHNFGIASIFLAAYVGLINEVTKREKIVIGIPVSTRKSEEQNNTLGLYVNTVLVPIEILDKMEHVKYIEKLSRELLRAMEDSDIQMTDILSSQIDVDYSKAPFDFMFAFQNMELNELKFESVDSKSIDIKNDTAKSAIRLIIWEYEDEFRIVWEYNPKYFNISDFSVKHEIFEKKLTIMIMS